MLPPDNDGIIPMMEADWFPDDASNQLVEFISVAWPKEYLEENLTFIADSLGPNRNEQPRDTMRRYLWVTLGVDRGGSVLVVVHTFHQMNCQQLVVASESNVSRSTKPCFTMDLEGIIQA